MDTRFAHLRQRDTSVSMLRVKMSRRRSQSQKENRDRVVNTRRQLEKLPEMAIAMANLSTIREKTQNNAQPAKSTAVEERLKQLERWKERKALAKDKEKRDKERKGVFKTGLYHPKDAFIVPALPVVPAATKRSKETKMNTTLSQSTRVTRSMKQQQQQMQQPLKTRDHNALAKKAPPGVERSTRTRVAPVKPTPAPTKVCAVEPVVATRPPVTAAPAVKDKPKHKAADVRSTRSRGIANPVAPPTVKENNCNATVDITAEPPVPTEPEQKEVEDMVVDHESADSLPAVEASSFAPQNFVFQAPVGLSDFKFDPLTPRSADAFLTPTFSLPPVPLFNIEPLTELSEPSPAKSPRRSPPPSLTVARQTPGSPAEPKHDVPYFRSEIVNETDHLSTLCVQWESKVEDESIPEEMRDRMRTAVGQARLLMKERFHQFSGLVDDCELGRGEKITTCTDLQGFWDMVYYQVEDVKKKFEALREAEGRGWVEEHKPPPRQRKVVKKTVTAPAKPAGTKAGGAKSRLAAAKAAMKARQQAAEAESAAEDVVCKSEDIPTLDTQHPQPQADAPNADTVVFDGDFFQVESPAKRSGSVRRSSRLSVAAPPPASPLSNYLTPRRMTRRSLALAQTPVQSAPSPARSALTPAALRLTLDDAPESLQEREPAVNVSLCFSPVKEVTSEDGSPEPQTETSPASAPEPSTDKPVHSIPSICVVEDEDQPDEEADLVLPVPRRLSLSPCKSPSMSFTMSPCVSLSEPPTTSSSSPPAAPAEQSLTEATPSRCQTPDNSAIEEIPGLDFERYFQPSQRCSLSPPREAVAMETTSLLSSPVAVDIDMESPTALPAVSSVLTLHSPQIQTAECDLLLFTPDLKDRIRQSVCPNDLMVFTPPT
ncbi:hypothetical protein JOB18_042432 [Solea senegalensis]|uniref:Disks large-associated protein 5 isoform X1 n=1 Tax=Solea senegalensis TaxID=28829 RepID=A0AAV6RV91_SOLSE|nr:disks large-associated protein 5 isoform X1 [Solea senegalensis]KAG7507706.1 disks large-associated protein 5 isoform X1 [Solea senegalensis]KAG7507708.1 hypothetical protein JOB18_042432 [Solea senegalensis]